MTIEYDDDEGESEYGLEISKATVYRFRAPPDLLSHFSPKCFGPNSDFLVKILTQEMGCPSLQFTEIIYLDDGDGESGPSLKQTIGRDSKHFEMPMCKEVFDFLTHLETHKKLPSNEVLISVLKLVEEEDRG